MAREETLEFCEDCISRKAVNEGFKKYINSSFAYGCLWDYVNKLPSVTPKKKRFEKE